jgi:hypothetical protein
LNPPPNLLSLIGAPPGYLFRARAPLRFHLALSKPLWLLWALPPPARALPRRHWDRFIYFVASPIS